METFLSAKNYHHNIYQTGTTLKHKRLSSRMWIYAKTVVLAAVLDRFSGCVARQSILARAEPDSYENYLFIAN